MSNDRPVIYTSAKVQDFCVRLAIVLILIFDSVPQVTKFNKQGNLYDTNENSELV